LRCVSLFSLFASLAVATLFVGVARETLFPTARLLAEAIGHGSVPAMAAAFVVLAALVATTGYAPEAKGAAFPLAPREVPWTLLVPVLLGLSYGQVHPDPPLWQRSDIASSVLWYVLAVPLAEELVFRGGLYGALLRTGAARPLTASNPLPTAVWLSAAAFAVWHWDAGMSTMLRTFGLGLWLGWLRWRTGGGPFRGCRLPALAHGLVNGAAILL
jgi:membrane protease YdiL (CAAX protease family)